MTHHTDPNLTQAPNLVREFLAHLRGLFVTEARIAKEELSEAVSRAGTGAVYLAIALLFALVAFHALALTGVLALAALGIPMVWAALATSVLVLIVAAIFAFAGSRCLKKSALAPKRTLAHLRSDLSSFEEATRV
ncbi:phage holin family protein [Marivita sp. S6314]|uniref:phage holin family protein n=1 Tax=Marivita sp. S6314 TaxID=2926406 RepID=UPI001FF6E5C6|nr:phage holin family protein [Marivita sp. S6314]MCK0149509.1 phage holin family protein [Marivita sp. S6314]